MKLLISSPTGVITTTSLINSLAFLGYSRLLETRCPGSLLKEVKTPSGLKLGEHTISINLPRT